MPSQHILGGHFGPPTENIPRFREFDDQFRSETGELLIVRLRLSLMIGALLFLLFSLLDATRAPAPTLARLLTLRLIIAGCMIAGVAITYTKRGQRLARPLSVLTYGLGSAGVTIMTSWLGGFSSDYYVGHVLVLFFSGFFLPWTPRLTLAFGLLSSGFYFAVNLALFGVSTDVAAPLLFIASGILAAVFAASFSTRVRKKNLNLRLQVERVNQELQRSDDVKTRLFTNVSHELRTPLTMILGAIDQLKSNPGDTPSELVEALSTNGRRLHRQVNMVLDFARIEADRMRCEFATGNIGTLVAAVVSQARPYCDNRRLTLTSSGLASLPDTHFDKEKIETIATNLLANAIKFTPEGGTIVVSATNHDSTIELSFEDTGIGIAKQQLQQIFERFHRPDDDGPLGSSGTGLGLALVKELVQLHGGEVDVRSQENVGSIFSVTLPHAPPARSDRRRQPRRRQDRFAKAYFDRLIEKRYERDKASSLILAELQLESDADADTTVEILREDLQAPADAPTMLIIEDEPQIRAMLRQGLGREFRISTAKDGVQGLEKARQRKPDIIIADMVMPRLSGAELCRAIRTDPALRHTPFVLLTSKMGAEAAAEGLDSGADDYLTKPFSIEETRARVRAVLRARQTEAKLDEREARLAAIGRATSAVAHDLRSPLQTIVGHADIALTLLKKATDPKETSTDLEAIKEAAQQANHMVADIIAFAREGSAQLTLEKVPIITFLKKHALQHRENLAAVSIQLVETWPSGHENLEVPLDKGRIQRVLDNLLRNAREAVLLGRVSAPAIYFSLTIESDAVVIRVADNGPGVDESILRQLFQPFTTSGKHHGTGLGLTIVNSIVRAHGGALRVEPSATEGGAAFRIALPREAHAELNEFVY